MINQIYNSELILYKEYTDLKNKENQTIKCIQNLNQAVLILKNIKDKKKFFSSYSAIKKCFLSSKKSVNPIFKRFAIINAIQTEIQTTLNQQTKKIVDLIKIKNKAKEIELMQRNELGKTYLKLKRLSHILSHFLKLTCNYPEYHYFCDDTNKHFEYLIQESAITFVCNWIKLNLKFVKNETSVPNAPVIITLFLDKIHIFTNLK